MLHFKAFGVYSLDVGVLHLKNPYLLGMILKTLMIHEITDVCFGTVL